MDADTARAVIERSGLDRVSERDPRYELFLRIANRYRDRLANPQEPPGA